MNMNFGKGRQRKQSVCETDAPNFTAESEFRHRGSSRRRFRGKENPRERDFFAPDEVEEWVLPEYRSLFHHLFLKEEEDIENPSGAVGSVSGNDITPVTTKNISSLSARRRRKISPSGSTASSTETEDEGPLCNLVKSLPSWLKKVFNVSENDEQQQNADEIARHAWLDEIPIEICDRLRHIHIYV